MLKFISDDVWVCLDVIMEINHPLGANRFYNNQPHVYRLNLLACVLLGNDSASIPIFKLGSKELLGRFVHTDIQWLQTISAIRRHNYIHQIAVVQ